MDPILEEMARVRDPRDIRYARYLDWVDYLCTLVATKDDEIQTLKNQISAYDGQPEQKRGPGRPRKEAASV